MTRWLRPIGLLMVLVAALAYRSAESRPVLGRWSLMYAGLLGVLLIITLIAVWAALRPRAAANPEARRRGTLLDGGVFAFGLAYLIGEGSGRIADLNLFGSTHGGAIGLEWIALVLFICWGLMAWSARVESNTGKGLVSVVGALSGLALLGEGIIRAQAVLAPMVEAVPSVSTRRWLERHVQRNALGYRDAAPPAEGDTTRRLMIVGDSFAMGWGLPDLATRFGERLADALARRTGHDWRPVTVAEANRHTLDQVKMVEEAVSLCPDIVVLVYVFNDMDYLRVDNPSRSRSGTALLGIAFANSHLVQKGVLMLRVGLMGRPDAVMSRSPYSDTTLVSRHLEDLTRFVTIASSRGAATVIVPFEVSGVVVPAAAERYRRFVSMVGIEGSRLWRSIPRSRIARLPS